MHVREFRPADMQALQRIHAAQDFPYAFPDLSNPLFVTKIVLTDGDQNVAPGFSPASSSQSQDARAKNSDANERIVGAALLRLTAEAYLLLDPSQGTPRQRWQSLLALHEAARADAWQRGLEDAHAWLPPPIAKKFGRRLASLGWLRDDAWTPYCLRFGGSRKGVAP